MAGYGLSNFSIQNHTAAVIGCSLSQSNTAILTPNTPPAWHSSFVVNPQIGPSTVYPEPLGQGQGNQNNPIQNIPSVEPAQLCLVENTVLVLANYAHWM